MKKYLLFLLLLLPVLLTAQSTADEIENLLNSSVITYAQAARFTLEAAGVFATNDQIEAFNYALQLGWLPRDISPEYPARLNNISLLLMYSFNMKGGIMYSIFENAHYAYRELRFLNVIIGRTVPLMTVSGEQLLFYVNRMLVIQEAREN